MKKKQLLVVFLLACIVVAILPLASAQDAAKPTVTVPNSDWKLTENLPYPDEPAEHDPRGAGLLEYENQVNFDFVMIYYEKADNLHPSQSYLQAEAERIFERDHEDLEISQRGVTTYANVQAGFAKGYESDVDVYTLEIVFVKGNNYFNVFVYYDANAQSENDVTALINSINVTSSPIDFLQSYLIYIIVIIVLIVVVVILVVVRRKRKKPQQADQVTYAPQAPPPPPPPSYSYQ